MKLYCCIVIILRIMALCRAWNGIIGDSDAAGGTTQLIIPNANQTVGSVNFGLPHYQFAAVVQHPDENAYFIGGTASSVYRAEVTKFNPNTNTSSPVASMNTPRYGHAATIVGNQIIVCAGE